MPVPLVLAHLPLVACMDQVLPGRKHYDVLLARCLVGQVSVVTPPQKLSDTKCFQSQQNLSSLPAQDIVIHYFPIIMTLPGENLLVLLCN
jgi:hypothetical protein